MNLNVLKTFLNLKKKMANSKHSVVKGTQDFYGKDLLNRKFIINKISEIFSKYSFEPLETPAFEYLDLLSSNYGEEGDKLLYKILNSGDYMKDIDNSKPLTPQISEKGLRYDLTVPMMRYVAENVNKLTFPWRRFQIQPVWRADRPQKGRYREFYQCDIDIVGSKNLLCDAELLAITCESLEALQIYDFSISINHIGLFKGFLEYHNEAHRFKELFTIVDKVDKVGSVAIFEEMHSKNFSTEIISAIENLLHLSTKSNEKILHSLYTMLGNNESAKTSLDELTKILQYAKELKVKDSYVQINPLLARGLSYYTGTIFEAKTLTPTIGSIVGGGRYENMLENLFGLQKNQNVIDTAIGLSFGIDRIYALLEERNLLQNIGSQSPQILVVCMDEKFESNALEISTYLRSHNICVELSLDQKKLKKQLEYANKKQVTHLIIIGEEEMQNDKYTVKNMKTGEQGLIGVEEIFNKITI